MTLLSVPGKVFARIILDNVRHHLLEHQRPEQSGFTPKRSTIDRIPALRVLTERRRECQQGLLTAYVDLCKAFDSVNLDALCGGSQVFVGATKADQFDFSTILWY